MKKSYEGFLKSDLLWTNTEFGLEQFVLKNDKLDYKRLCPVPKNLRLGHQVEHIYLQLLKASNKYKVLAHSIQLIEYKRTLGELDFIIKSLVTDEIIHVELAYKFYLIDYTIDDVVEGLVGPNRGDAFTYKLDKTKNKQLPLLYSGAAKARLDIDVYKVKQKVAFYGEIFTPYQMDNQNMGILNSKSIKGCYIPLNLFITEDFSLFKFHFPTKSEWIHIPYSNVKWMDYESAIQIIKERHAINRSPMIWVYKGMGLIEKMFVTNWG